MWSAVRFEVISVVNKRLQTQDMMEGARGQKTQPKGSIHAGGMQLLNNNALGVFGLPVKARRFRTHEKG